MILTTYIHVETLEYAVRKVSEAAKNFFWFSKAFGESRAVFYARYEKSSEAKIGVASQANWWDPWGAQLCTFQRTNVLGSNIFGSLPKPFLYYAKSQYFGSYRRNHQYSVLCWILGSAGKVYCNVFNVQDGLPKLLRSQTFLHYNIKT